MAITGIIVIMIIHIVITIIYERCRGNLRERGGSLIGSSKDVRRCKVSSDRWSNAGILHEDHLRSL